MKETLTMALFLLLAAGCGHNHDDSHAEEQTAIEHHDEHEDMIVMAPEKATAAGVVAQPVVAADFNSVVKASGKILSASDDETAVVATAPGIVSIHRQIAEGMPVSRGASLFSISSSRLPEGELTARNSIAYEAAKVEFERAENLFADKLITEKEYRAAKTAYDNARLLYESSGSKSRGAIGVASPVGGYVKELLVKPGDYVEVGQRLMTVTQNRHLYLRAEVPERDYSRLNSITSAKFRTAYSDSIFDLSKLGGRLSSTGKTSSSGVSFISVTFEFDNHSGVVPGSYAEIYLIGATRGNVISVPLTALTEEQGVYYVYVKEDEDCYRKQEVKTGETDGERIEVTHGLKGGENVVTQGAIHVKLASSSNVIPGHTHNH